jgi:pyruvate-ferredoxin/flavodoxin oxidoreductase
MVCPHAVIRQKVYDASYLKNAPETFKSVDAKGFKEFPGAKFTLQVSVEDCTGCGLCVYTCPAKNKENPQLKAIIWLNSYRNVPPNRIIGHFSDQS